MVPEAQNRTQRPISAEEEALSRNTDCIYYLASPSTCKKGNECEFRHSEIARLNPQDCWFWLNGNCLNPKCGFRHPSLDGLLGTQTPTSSGHSVSQTRTATKNAPYAPNASGKQTVPCVFFQNGYCLKGDWCPFLHAPSSMSNKAVQVPALASASASDPTAIKKAIDMIEKSIQAKKTPPLPVKSVKQVLEPKPTCEVEAGGPRNEFFLDRSLQRRLVTNGFPGIRNIPPSENLVGWSDSMQKSHPLDEPRSMNVKEAEEASREHSPGFDVLVDDNVMRESDYYPGEDRYEYDHGGSEDYVDIDDDRYQDPHGHGSRGPHQDQYAREQHRASSETMSVGSYQVHESDLRHRLSKHKKPNNGLRSVISRQNTHVMRVQDRLGPHGDRRFVSEHDDALLSSRLRGRVIFPGSNGGITRRIQDKRRGRFEGSHSNGVKNSRNGDLRRHDAGPKSQNPLGKRKFPSVIEGHQQRPDSLKFDGPKSLDEILKRKRGEASGAKTIKSSVVGGSKGHEDVDSSTYKEVSDSTRSSQENEEGKNHTVETAGFEAEANGEKDEEGYDYEQTGEEDEYYEGENGDGVEEYVDDDDDFAKKMGLIHNTL